MTLALSPHVVKIKKDAGSYVIYHALFGRPVTVPKALWDGLERSMGRDPKLGARSSGAASVGPGVRNRFKKLGFLVEKGTDEYALLNKMYAPRRQNLESKLASGMLIDHLRLEMASFCNFRCRYCFAEKIYDWKKNSLMSFETARLAVDGFLAILARNGNTDAQITYWGGEPLVNWAVIRRTVEHAKQAARDFGIVVNSGFVTNGSLINDEVAAFMAEHSMSATVSLDGLGQDNDRARRYVNGRGTSRSILRGMDTLLRHGVYFWVEMTLHDYNFRSIEKSIDFIHDRYKVSTFIITPVHHQRSRTAFDSHSAHAKAKRMVEIYRYGVEKNIRICAENVTLANEVIEGYPGLFVCASKASSLYVKPDGRVYPCQKISTPTGDVRHMDKITSGDSYRYAAGRGIDKIAACRGCDIEGFCAGGCAGLAQFYSGDIYDTSDPGYQAFYCEYRRHLLKETLKYLSND